jgi:hypothetical protein
MGAAVPAETVVGAKKLSATTIKASKNANRINRTALPPSNLNIRLLTFIVFSFLIVSWRALIQSDHSESFISNHLLFGKMILKKIPAKFWLCGVDFRQDLGSNCRFPSSS